MPAASVDDDAVAVPDGPHGVLRAVLAADAAGYSRLLPENPSGTIATLNRHRARMRDIVRRHGGSDAGSPGDYLLALFAASGDALASAMEFLETQDDPGSEVELRFRVGLHVGDVFEQAGDVLGVAINLASRLQQSAPVGGILMSQTFRDSLPGKLRIPVVDLGELTLKHVDEPVRAYELRMPIGPESQGTAKPAPQLAVQPAKEAGARAPPSAGKARPRIYVRPFLAQGMAERAQIFADGLAEELVTTLGLFSDVFRTARALEGATPGDGYEIAGQVRNGDRLRITCHLIDRASGNTLWADRFDFSRDASYDAQERIAVAVINALHLKVTDGETASLWSNRTTSLAAWEQFHRGRMHEARYTADGNMRSKQHFARALEMDPDYVPAIVALGFSHLDAVRLGWTADEAADLAKALELAELARAKDATDAYALALLAYVERAQGKLEMSVTTMEAAVQLAPRNGELVAYYANMLWMQGHVAAAVQQNRRALELTPQPSSWMQSNLGLALLWDGRSAEAGDVFERVIAADPDYMRAYIGLSVARLRQGRLEPAAEAYRALCVIVPGFQPESWVTKNLNFNPQEAELFIADLRRLADLHSHS